jgi:hypothetical protein
MINLKNIKQAMQIIANEMNENIDEYGSDRYSMMSDSIEILNRLHSMLTERRLKK